jgi:hypothetical protein
MYLAANTHPDIAYAVHQAARYVGNTVVFPEFPTVVYPDIHVGFPDPRSLRAAHFHSTKVRLLPCAPT